MTNPKEVQFYNIICAWQHFAGKPLRVTDHASVLMQHQLSEMEVSLRALCHSFRTEDPNQWPELHQLADQVEKDLDR